MLARALPPTLLSLLAAGACTFLSPAADEGAVAASRADGAWDWCPTTTFAEEVEEGALWLQFSPEALYCSQERLTWSGEEDPIWDELEHKAQVRLVPSDNFLPLEEGRHSLAVPVCAQLGTGEGAGLAGEGELEVTTSLQLGREHLVGRYVQPIATGAQDLGFQLFLSGYRDELAAGLVLDGEPWRAPSPVVELVLCDDAACAEGERRRLQSCNPEAERRETWDVGFEGGSLRVTLLTDRNGWDVIAAERAEGILDGEAFVVDDFFDLAARPSWPWSSSRDVAIRLGRVPGTPCGLSLRELRSGGTPRPLQVMTCDGGHEERPVLFREREIDTDEEP